MLRNCLIPDDAAAISESFFHPEKFLNNQKKSKRNSLFNPRSSTSESESSVRSPKSPFEFGLFSSFNSFRQRSQNMVNQKSWDHTKVGLSIIDDETKSKSHLLERQMNIDSPNFCIDVTPPKRATTVFQNIPQPKPANVEFEIGDNTKYEDLRGWSSLDDGKKRNRSSFWSGKSKSVGGSLPNLTGNPSVVRMSSIPREIEESEEYTCVIKHGSNPEVTHYYGRDRIVNTADEITESSEVLPEFDDMLKFCGTCKKKLEGEDVYMYRGEEAFCSHECRDVQIEIDEHIEKTNNSNKKKSEDSDKPNSSSQDIFTSCSIFFTA